VVEAKAVADARSRLADSTAARRDASVPNAVRCFCRSAFSASSSWTGRRSCAEMALRIDEKSMLLKPLKVIAEPIVHASSPANPQDPAGEIGPPAETCNDGEGKRDAERPRRRPLRVPCRLAEQRQHGRRLTVRLREGGDARL